MIKNFTLSGIKMIIRKIRTRQRQTQIIVIERENITEQLHEFNAENIKFIQLFDHVFSRMHDKYNFFVCSDEIYIKVGRKKIKIPFENIEKISMGKNSDIIQIYKNENKKFIIKGIKLDNDTKKILTDILYWLPEDTCITDRTFLPFFVEDNPDVKLIDVINGTYLNTDYIPQK